MTFSKVVFGVAATMSRIHALHIIHAWFRPWNVLINARGEPLLTGFHWSRFDSKEIEYVTDVNLSVFQAPEGERLGSDVTEAGHCEL
jgi:hypothetical protein